MGKIQKYLDSQFSDGATPSKRDLATLGDLMLGGKPPRRRQKRKAAHQTGVGSPTTKAKWKAGGKRQAVKVYSPEEKAALATAMGLSTHGGTEK